MRKKNEQDPAYKVSVNDVASEEGGPSHENNLSCEEEASLQCWRRRSRLRSPPGTISTDELSNVTGVGGGGCGYIWR